MEVDVERAVAPVASVSLALQLRDVCAYWCGHRFQGRCREQSAPRCFPGEEPPARVTELLVVIEPLDEPFGLVDEPLLSSGRRPRAHCGLDHAADDGRHARPVCRRLFCQIRLVSAEQLVAAVTGERNLDFLSGQSRDEVGRKDREVADRIVHEVHETIERDRRPSAG